MNETVTVRRADLSEAPRLADVLAMAYQDDPVSCWLLPDERERKVRQRGFFEVLVEHAITFGEAHTTDQYHGVALWLEVGPEVSLTPDHSHLDKVLGDSYQRYYQLYRLTEALHPYDVQHQFLPFIGVAVEHQGQGVGTALLRHQFAELETSPLPVYMEASSERGRNWFIRLGFKRLPMRVQLPDNGPELWSLWRPEPTPEPVPADVQIPAPRSSEEVAS